MSSHCERIVYREDRYQIEREYPDKRLEFFEIDHWGFTKHTTAICLIKRETENLESLEEPTNVTFYEIGMSFDVLDTPIAKPIYLKKEKVRKILSTELKYYETYSQVFIKDMDTTQTRFAMPQNLEGFPYSVVRVTKGKAKRVSFQRAKELLDSGECYAIFGDVKLEKRLC